MEEGEGGGEGVWEEVEYRVVGVMWVGRGVEGDKRGREEGRVKPKTGIRRIVRKFITFFILTLFLEVFIFYTFTFFTPRNSVFMFLLISHKKSLLMSLIDRKPAVDVGTRITRSFG